MSDQATETVKKPSTEYEEVVMSDGRKEQFPGKRQIQKEINLDEAAGTVAVRFDFRNGATLSLASNELSASMQLKNLGHGIAQKCGDEASGLKKIEDIVAAVEDMMDRLRKGEWRVATGSGDSFSGAGIVVRAVAEASGKTVEDIKAFLQKKLDTAKTEGKALSRQDLYASFRKPGTKTAAIILRMEAEDAAGKTTKVSADDLLGELTA